MVIYLFITLLLQLFKEENRKLLEETILRDKKLEVEWLTSVKAFTDKIHETENLTVHIIKLIL